MLRGNREMMLGHVVGVTGMLLGLHEKILPSRSLLRYKDKTHDEQESHHSVVHGSRQLHGGIAVNFETESVARTCEGEGDDAILRITPPVPRKLHETNSQCTSAPRLGS